MSVFSLHRRLKLLESDNLKLITSAMMRAGECIYFPEISNSLAVFKTVQVSGVRNTSHLYLAGLLSVLGEKR